MKMGERDKICLWGVWVGGMRKSRIFRFCQNVSKYICVLNHSLDGFSSELDKGRVYGPAGISTYSTKYLLPRGKGPDSQMT